MVSLIFSKHYKALFEESLDLEMTQMLAKLEFEINIVPDSCFHLILVSAFKTKYASRSEAVTYPDLALFCSYIAEKLPSDSFFSIVRGSMEKSREARR